MGKFIAIFISANWHHGFLQFAENFLLLSMSKLSILCFMKFMLRCGFSKAISRPTCSEWTSLFTSSFKIQLLTTWDLVWVIVLATKFPPCWGLRQKMYFNSQFFYSFSSPYLNFLRGNFSLWVSLHLWNRDIFWGKFGKFLICHQQELQNYSAVNKGLSANEANFMQDCHELCEEEDLPLSIGDPMWVSWFLIESWVCLVSNFWIIRKEKWIIKCIIPISFLLLCILTNPSVI